MTNEGKVLVSIGVVTLALFIGGIFMLSKKTAPVSQAPVDPAVLVREDSWHTGSDTPTVTIVEFGDYQCPFCAQAHPSIKALLAAHPDTLRFVFRDFPLSQHKNAQIAAEAAQAAGVQGKYWEMYDMLYERQNEWAESTDTAGIFARYAGELSLDIQQFSQELADHTHRARVQAGLIDGNQLSVNSTPTFFVNGARFTGSMEDLQSLVKSLLSSESAAASESATR